MSNVVLFPGHLLHGPRCFICDGGLAQCNVCGGAEAALPTDCPGGRMTANEMDQVQAGKIDFVRGGWVLVNGLLLGAPG